ncbi:MAG TPA: Gfo/Idh/MocA family oxidoreductase, partial [Bryobacteraceae bacterium]|nr:Gfo/Idh/MocA family oxidoreductase [Bryobacteraceae bacterium]
MALIGAGAQGIRDANDALRVPGVHLVAVADPNRIRLARARDLWGNDLRITGDYESLLVEPGVDAVIVATPDHWRHRIVTEALAAGKSVYCESPALHGIADAGAIIARHRETGRTMQIGNERPAPVLLAKAREMLRQGLIGQLVRVEASCDRDLARAVQEQTRTENVGAGDVNWHRFLGNAPKRSFDPARLFGWRNYRDYGNGAAGEVFVDFLSSIQIITGALSPERVEAAGSLRFWNDGRDVPDSITAIYDYPAAGGHDSFAAVLSARFVQAGNDKRALRFIGTEGTMTLAKGIALRRGRAAGEWADCGVSARELFRAHSLTERMPGSEHAEDAGYFAAPRGYSASEDRMARFFSLARDGKSGI